MLDLAPFRSLFRAAAAVLLMSLLLFGLLYPFAMTGLAQLIFPHQANGSLIMEEEKVVGSAFIGQHVTNPRYFFGRPSATFPSPYNAASSAGMNASIASAAFAEMVRVRVEALRKADPGNKELIPIDLVTASASGLDPHISPAAAHFQARRVARLRGMEEKELRVLIDAHVEPPQWGFFGMPKVNVLALNRALDYK